MRIKTETRLCFELKQKGRRGNENFQKAVKEENEEREESQTIYQDANNWG